MEGEVGKAGCYAENEMLDFSFTSPCDRGKNNSPDLLHPSSLPDPPNNPPRPLSFVNTVSPIRFGEQTLAELRAKGD